MILMRVSKAAAQKFTSPPPSPSCKDVEEKVPSIPRNKSVIVNLLCLSLATVNTRSAVSDIEETNDA